MGVAERTVGFFTRLDRVVQDAEYYDDDLGDTVCELTEEQIYEAVVTEEDVKFLSEEKIKSIIHYFMSDYVYRDVVLSVYNLY